MPPITAGGRIRAVTELEDLLAISMDEHLCLVDYVEQVALGRYAVYRIQDADGGPVAGQANTRQRPSRRGQKPSSLGPLVHLPQNPLPDP